VVLELVKNELIKLWLRRLKRKTLPIAEDVPKMRAFFNKQAKRFPVSWRVRTVPVKINKIEGEWIKPLLGPTKKVILYLHGGGYGLGSINTHRSMMAQIAIKSNIRVLAINYRLAPEHPYPAALEDTLETYQWLLANGYKPKNIIISGDSAGGGLALSTLLKIRDEKLPNPAAAIVLSPWTDLCATGKSIKLKAHTDPIIHQRDLTDWSLRYAGKVPLDHPYISPLYADLCDLPPILIQTGQEEILLDDSVRFAQKAKKCGVNVQLEVYEGMIHVWHVLWQFLPKSREAITSIGEFANKHIK